PATDSLIEVLCLAHDIGHPPFGHGGEVALHYMMHNHGGFEGNGQTFRIIARLEPFTEQHGMNLTRRTLLGLIKYPQTLTTLNQQIKNEEPCNFRQLKTQDWHPPKGLYDDDNDILDWVLEPLSINDRHLFQQTNPAKNDKSHQKTRFKSLDCSIMELADDIAYGIHDLEDAIVTGIVNRNDFELHVIDKLININEPWLNNYCKDLTQKLFSHQHHLQKDAIGELVNYLITAIELTNLNETCDEINFDETLLKFNATLPNTIKKVLQVFKDFVYYFVIKQPSIQQREYRGQQVVMELFEALSSDPLRLLPSNTAKRYINAKQNNKNYQRVISDYVAGMTDGYANKLYQTLFKA
nr:dGTPase [Colwellia sp.]